MTQKDIILREMQDVSDNFTGDVLNYIRFLKFQHFQEKIEITSLSESALKKDWLLPEEEIAWQNL